MMNTTTASQEQIGASERVKAVLAALIVGFGLLYVVGFAASASVHNAAHDSRHSLAFPCH